MTAPARKLPALTPETAPFWTGGEHGTLLIQRKDFPTRIERILRGYTGDATPERRTPSFARTDRAA